MITRDFPAPDLSPMRPKRLDADTSREASSCVRDRSSMSLHFLNNVS